MSLSQAQYDEIMRSYERRREDSRHAVEENRRIVRDAIPEYRHIENSITDLAVKRANAALEGDTALSEKIKKEMSDLIARQEQLLGENGFANDFLTEKHVCPDCKDTGYINGSKCHCLRQAILHCTYSQSNIDEVLKRENFDTLDYDLYTDSERESMREVVKECRKFADDFGSRYENILLYGDVGSGKTFLTNCMTKAIMDRGYSVIYFTSVRLFDTLSGVYFSRDDEAFRRSSIQQDIHNCDLLIIDDLGTENVNSFVASRLFDILNERDVRRKSTIISTNLSFEELGGRYTDRSFSRIFGNFRIIHPDVSDMRIRKRRSAN